MNSSLWGGVFNFIIPLFKQVPARYREQYFKTIPAKATLNGLAEAFQPDFLKDTQRRKLVHQWDYLNELKSSGRTPRDEARKGKLRTLLRNEK